MKIELALKKSCKIIAEPCPNYKKNMGLDSKFYCNKYKSKLNYKTISGGISRPVSLSTWSQKRDWRNWRRRAEGDGSLQRDVSLVALLLLLHSNSLSTLEGARPRRASVHGSLDTHCKPVTLACMILLNYFPGFREPWRCRSI
ncbi:hypothetical protein CRG98_025733 [Punica granatum]|uniref:Uncharacterized protein n=1 Tax=Punica granatum TaxID=22663 RepID=A0A2I0JCB8_PUNGR|nr:hypothetical protein CRG98_025733 [Punica granatum]